MVRTGTKIPKTPEEALPDYLLLRRAEGLREIILSGNPDVIGLLAFCRMLFGVLQQKTGYSIVREFLYQPQIGQQRDPLLPVEIEKGGSLLTISNSRLISKPAVHFYLR